MEMVQAGSEQNTAASLPVFGDRYADFYDSIYETKDYVAEANFAKNLFTEAATIPVKNILDFGCGTGRHSVEFARAGFHVTGVDISSEMLTRARRRGETQGLNLTLANKIPEQKFEAAVSLFAVVNYLPTPQDLVDKLTEIREHLTPGGSLVVETWNGAAVPFSYEKTKTREMQTSLGKIVRRTESYLDWQEQILEIAFECAVENGPIFKETHSMRYYTLQQMERFAEEAGLRCVKILPAYETRDLQLNDFNVMFAFRRDA